MELRHVTHENDKPVNGRWMRADFQPGLVSVVMPTYNRADFLVETLDSIRAQSYRPIEVVLVDDGSTDRTPEVVEQWREAHGAGGDLVLQYVRQANRGPATARNRGLRESRGEFVQFLDSDDLLHPEKLSTQQAEFANDDRLDFVYSDYAMFDGRPDWDCRPYHGQRVERPLAALLTKAVWVVHSGLYRRRTCRAVGPWNPRLTRMDDLEYHVRVALRESRVAYRPGVLSLYRVHGQARLSIVGRDRQGLRDAMRAIGSVRRQLGPQCDEDAQLADGMAALYFGIVWGGLRHGFPDVARDAAKRGLRLRVGPFRRLEFHLLRFLTLVPSSWGPGLIHACREAAGSRIRRRVWAILR